MLLLFTVPHPVPWTHICAMPPGGAHTPRAPRRRVIPKLLETPGLVVPLHEVGHGGADGLEVLKDSAVDRLLLERAIPPLRHPVRFRFLDKAEAGVDPPIPDLLEEVV